MALHTLKLLPGKRTGISFAVRQSLSGGIQFENGLPVTHAEGHGIGVRSICAIVEKYKGLSDFSVQDGRFILRVSL